MSEEQPHYGDKRPCIEWVKTVAAEKSWGVETLVALGPSIWKCFEATPMARARLRYAGKILRRTTEGKRGGLQYHTQRDETFHLVSGEVIVYWVDAEGVLRQREMHPGESVHVPIGAIHSVQTLTESVMFEVSIGTVTSGDAVNVEDQYDISQARRDD